MRRSDAALAQDQAYRWQSEYLRHKRELTTNNAAQLTKTLAKLDNDAATNRREVARHYFDQKTNIRLTLAELRATLAAEQLKAAQDYLAGHQFTVDGQSTGVRPETIDAARNPLTLHGNLLASPDVNFVKLQYDTRQKSVCPAAG